MANTLERKCEASWCQSPADWALSGHWFACEQHLGVVIGAVMEHDNHQAVTVQRIESVAPRLTEEKE